MPRLSDTMTEGTVAAWLKKSRRQNQRRRYCEIETDKATMELNESFHEGTLCILVYQKAKQQR
jgi:pyruvate dehydrogenase E2 component (dihydrolipoamide acetyltransferase)